MKKCSMEKPKKVKKICISCSGILIRLILFHHNKIEWEFKCFYIYFWNIFLYFLFICYNDINNIIIYI